MDLGARLLQRMVEKDLSQAELARRIGIAQPSVNHLIKNGPQGSKHLNAIARELKTTPEFLTGQTDNPDEGYVALPSINEVAESLDLVEVSEIDLKYGMGSTDLEVPITKVTRHFSRAWLRQYTNAHPSELVWAQGIGDSMFPTIWDSDVLLIDMSEKAVRVSDKFWAIAYGNSGMVKRLRPMPDGSVRLLSDNPNVPDDVAHDGEMHVIGRIAAIVRKM